MKAIELSVERLGRVDVGQACILRFCSARQQGDCEVLTFENDSSPAFFCHGGGLDGWGGRYWSRVDGVAAMGLACRLVICSTAPR